jgi:hypothetical protein
MLVRKHIACFDSPKDFDLTPYWGENDKKDLAHMNKSTYIPPNSNLIPAGVGISLNDSGGTH